MKRIVIIGASSGIGLKTALHFAAMGWKVALAARRTQPLVAVCNQYPSNVIYAPIDITETQAHDKLLNLIERLGGMNIILNAAGNGWANPDLDTEKEITCVKTNAEGFVRIIDTAFNYFADNNIPGRIVSITSVAGTKGLGISPAYSATKAFTSRYLQALEQLASIRKLNISITDIRPGFIRTPLLDPKRNYPLIMTLDYAVPKIVKAVISGSSVVYIDWRWAIVVSLWKLIPDFIWRKLKIKL